MWLVVYEADKSSEVVCLHSLALSALRNRKMALLPRVEKALAYLGRISAYQSAAVHSKNAIQQ